MASINIDPKKISSLAAKAVRYFERAIADQEKIIRKIESPKNKKGTWAYFLFGSGVDEWDGFTERAKKYHLDQKRKMALSLERLAETAISNEATMSVTDEELTFLEKWAGEEA